MRDHSLLSPAAIRRAARLDERIGQHDGRPSEPVDPSLADKRMDQWRSETGLADASCFAERLGHVGLSESAFRVLLADSSCDTHPRREEDDPWPGWLKQLDLAYRTEGTPGEVMPLGDLIQAPDRALVAPARRVLDHAWGQMLGSLRARSAEASHAWMGTPDTLATCLGHALPLDVFRMINRASLLELHIARFEERLTGTTPEARFESFVAEMESPAGASLFFDRYPVLARDIAMHCDQWLEANLTLVDRLAQDLEAITAHFASGAALGSVVGVELGLSDRHHNGQGVAILTFTSGTKVVYKPRPMAVDLAFASLLDWFNGQADGAVPPLASPAAIDRGDYGWVAFAEAHACADTAAVSRYYQRQGAFIALLYAIDATDFHHENVIACGEHPMLIDLETLYQPVAGRVRLAEGDSRPVAFNVLRNGLLPLRFSSDPNAQGFDVSGLGGLDNPKIGARIAVNVGMDTMAYTPAQEPMPQHRNRPRLRTDTPDSEGEREILVWEHTADVVAGFEAAMSLLIAEKESLLSADGPLAAFDGLELRYIARPTNVYVRLLEAMRHPDFQQDGLARDRLLDKLWLDATRFPHFRTLIPYERHSLAHFDVPRFRCQTDSLDLLAEDGTRIPSYLDITPAEQVRNRIGQLDADDQARQRWLIEASIAAIQPIDQRFQWEPKQLQAARHPFQPGRALALAQETGEHLAQLSLRISRDARSWFQLDIAADDTWRLEPAGCDLYNGLPGIALFFAQLADVTGSDHEGGRFRRMAEEAFETARLAQRAPSFFWSRIGGWNGLGGWLYCRAHLARLWRDDQVLEGSAEETTKLASLIGDDRGLDVIAGAAGAIGGLLALHEVKPDAAVLEAAKACGEHLLRTAEERPEGGIAWPAVDGSAQPLTGFAHGTAGFAWSLARLAAATDDGRYAEAARQAFAYERAFFDGATGAWPDLRAQRREQWRALHDDDSLPFFYAWCHGAPGIGLSRLACLDLLDEREAMTAEIRAAVTATFAHGFGMNHGLCHGDLGNLEIVRRAAETLDDTGWRLRSNQLAASILEDIEVHGRRSGIGPGVDQPGLMTGIAGIGYGLLRLAAPERVPSVLTFELPPAVD